MTFVPWLRYIHLLLPLTTATVVIPRAITPIEEGVDATPTRVIKRDVDWRNAYENATTSHCPPSTITPAPTPWKSYVREYPISGCNPVWSDPVYGTLSFNRDWCYIRPQEVHLVYWPTGAAAGNRTYPSTTFLRDWGVTMTSASIYYMVHEFDAIDWCGQFLGPMVTSFVHSYALSEVSTLMPYADENATTRIGPPRQLQLSDLRTDCSTWETIPVKNHNTMTDGCNAIVEFKEDIITALAKKINGWHTCIREFNGYNGIFDPPVPVAQCVGSAEECGDSGANMVFPTPGQGDSSSAPTTTSSAVQEVPTSTPSTQAEPSQAISSMPTETAPPSTITTTPTMPEAPQTKIPSLSSATPSSIEPEVPAEPSAISDPEGSSPDNSVVTQSPTPPASDIIPGGAIAPSSAITDNSDTGSGGLSSDPSRPIAATIPIPILTLPNSEVVSTIPGASSVVIGSHTLAQGSPGITMSGGEVISVEPSGLIVSNTGNGEVVTHSIPAAPMAAITPTPILTLPNSEIVSAVPGASSVVIGSQTLSQGSPAITIAGGEVVSLTPSGLAVSNIDGSEAVTYPLPILSAAARPTPTLGIVAGYTISGEAVGASAAVIDGQTLTLGGAAITLSGNQVATLGSSGLMIAAPGGLVTTLAIPTPIAILTVLPSTTGTVVGVKDSSEVPTTLSSAIQLAATNVGSSAHEKSGGGRSRSMGPGVKGWLGCTTIVVALIIGL
ncbi:hypothetical protein BP5796_12046 [Coleophoma crateriformis]|uniref:Uncharacterized protein n=1 Tax=Coleophoma crateriformis TaxID=565419 RepID=A0A3D8QBA0_9HELO|nr:hypothetical protein BP5796_12046 [Coleophoma crateriformis]